jgi:hypothetical protein
MAADPTKSSPTPGGSAPPAAAVHHKGVRIFTYPKIIFILPTFFAAVFCGIAMLAFGDKTHDPTKPPPGTVAQANPKATPSANATKATSSDGAANPPAIRRFSQPQNVLGMIFLIIFGLNLLVMAIDFPRFTIIALILLAAAVGFFILWLNVYFNLIPPIVAVLESIYAVANSGFYFMLATAMLINFGIIWATRYLDYWEILPNEILHNHGPFSDLERFPTFNMKFDKEIPDILEYALLRSGRLVLHVPTERKAIVLDNVLWIDSKEAELKKLMSRMEVRVTTDQEAAAEPI